MREYAPPAADMLARREVAGGFDLYGTIFAARGEDMTDATRKLVDEPEEAEDEDLPS